MLPVLMVATGMQPSGADGAEVGLPTPVVELLPGRVLLVMLFELPAPAPVLLPLPGTVVVLLP